MINSDQGYSDAKRTLSRRGGGPERPVHTAYPKSCSEAASPLSLRCFETRTPRFPPSRLRSLHRSPERRTTGRSAGRTCPIDHSTSQSGFDCGSTRNGSCKSCTKKFTAGLADRNRSVCIPKYEMLLALRALVRKESPRRQASFAGPTQGVGKGATPLRAFAAVAAAREFQGGDSARGPRARIAVSVGAQPDRPPSTQPRPARGRQMGRGAGPGAHNRHPRSGATRAADR